MSKLPLHYWSLLDLSAAIHAGRVSPVEVTEALLARIAATDGALHSYVRVLHDAALAEARVAEAEIARGFWRGPLHGVPIAVKDLYYTQGVPTTGGMAIYDDFVPEHDATVVARLRQAGAILLGKLKTTEGAYAGHHPSVTPPVNPWSASHWTGASSSGSGVATAAGLCFGSLGSDTGGSIRFPSSCCGLTGLKPTWGRVSRHNVFALADSLDHVGPMTRTAADAAAMLAVIAGADPNDPTSVPDAVPDYLAALGAPLGGLRIGFDAAFASDGVEPEVTAGVHAAAEIFAKLGAVVHPFTFPSPEKAIGAWEVICATETAIVHQATYPNRGNEYGPVLAGLIDIGRRATGVELASALLERQSFNGALAHRFIETDLLLIPTMTTPAPSLADLAGLGSDPAKLLALLRFTAPFDLSRHPTLTLPAGFSAGGLPLSFQLVGHHLAEATLLRAGHAFQQATDWHTHHPEID